MKVTKISAMNFRSIRGLTLDLTGFDCFVGPNNSGKSNLFDVFTFLSDITTAGFGQAVLMRDAAKLRHYAAPETEPVVVEVWVDLGPPSKFDRVEYTLGFHTNPVVMEREVLSVFSKPGEAKTLFAMNRGDDGRATYRYWGGNRENVEISPVRESGLRQSDGYGDAAPLLRLLNVFLSKFRRYKFVPDRLKLWGPATWVERLNADGSNFASYLHTVQSGHGGHFDRI